MLQTFIRIYSYIFGNYAQHNDFWNKSITFLTGRWNCRQRQPFQPGSRRGAAGTLHCQSSSLCHNNRRIRRSTAGSPAEAKHTPQLIIQGGEHDVQVTLVGPSISSLILTFIPKLSRSMDMQAYRVTHGWNTFPVFYIVFRLFFNHERHNVAACPSTLCCLLLSYLFGPGVFPSSEIISCCCVYIFKWGWIRSLTLL